MVVTAVIPPSSSFLPQSARPVAAAVVLSESVVVAGSVSTSQLSVSDLSTCIAWFISNGWAVAKAVVPRVVVLVYVDVFLDVSVSVGLRDVAMCESTLASVVVTPATIEVVVTVATSALVSKVASNVDPNQD